MPEYKIIIHKNGIYIKENYKLFKYRYWFEKRDTISLDELTKTDSGYVEIKKKKPLHFIYFDICDSIINKIRNSASYWKMQGDIDRIVRDRIGYDNKKFQEFKNNNRPAQRLFHQNCHTDYKLIEEVLKNKLLRRVDSIYNDKLEKYEWIKANKHSISQDYVDNFMKTFNDSDPDFRSIGVIIENSPEQFLKTTLKFSDIEFYTLTLKLDGFPQDMDLTELKSILKQTQIKGKRKRKIIKKMKNNEG